MWLTADVKYVRYEMQSANGGQDEMKDLIQPYKTQIDAVMDEVLGTLSVDLTKERMESSIGNWLTDAMLDEAQNYTDKPLDFAFYNQGGVRSNYMGAGDITVRTIYELIPFENEMVVLEVPGDYLKTLFDKIASRGGDPISRNISFVIKDGNAENIKIDDEELDLKRNYRFVLSDYVVNSSSDSKILGSFPQELLKVKIRDAVIEHVRKDTENGIVQFAEIEGRITNAN